MNIKKFIEDGMTDDPVEVIARQAARIVELEVSQATMRTHIFEMLSNIDYELRNMSVDHFTARERVRAKVSIYLDGMLEGKAP